MSLLEVCVVATIVGVVAIIASRSMTNTQERNLENERMSRAQQELDIIAKQLKKDFERHLAAAGISGAVNTNFTVPATGQRCANVTIRQQNVSLPGKVRRIAYSSVCPNTNVDFPSGFTNTNINAELNCLKAPNLTIDTFADETLTTKVTQTYPTKNSTAVAVCFRPDVALGTETQYSAEIAVTYESFNHTWKVLRKTLTLVIAEFGSGVEIIPPN